MCLLGLRDGAPFGADAERKGKGSVQSLNS